MSLWRVIVDFIVGLLTWWRRRQDEAIAADEAKQKDAEEKAREISENIRDKVDDVEAPPVDASDASDDPGGFGRWNRDASRR